MSPATSDQEAGACHDEMLGQARDTQLRITVLPGNMRFMLEHDRWRRLLRPIDQRVFENAAIADWVLGPPWPGLAFPDWATVYALLGKNIEHGAECVRLLQERGAPTVERAEADFQVKLVKVKGDIAETGTRGRGRADRSYIITPNRGTSPEYLARRLHRVKPDIFAAFERGDYPSVHAAALAAGIIRPASALDLLRRAWRRATPAEREAFLKEIGAVLTASAAPAAPPAGS